MSKVSDDFYKHVVLPGLKGLVEKIMLGYLAVGQTKRANNLVNQLSQEYLSLYQEKYTDEEMQEITNFLTSPTGKKFWNEKDDKEFNHKLDSVISNFMKTLSNDLADMFTEWREESSVETPQPKKELLN